MDTKQIPIVDGEAPTVEDHFQFTRIVIAILVRKLGGEITVTQDEFDVVAGQVLLDRQDEKGFHLKLVTAEEAEMLMGVKIPTSNGMKH